MCLSLGDTRLGASVQWERGWGSKGQRLSAQSSQMTEGKWDSPRAGGRGLLCQQTQFSWEALLWFWLFRL